MRALTICQPWAHAIAWLGKCVENRTWGTAYRGPLLIHAGLARHWLTSSACLEVQLAAGITAPERAREWPSDPWKAGRMCAFGAIVAVADLADVVHQSAGLSSKTIAAWKASGAIAWFSGPYGLALRQVRPLHRPVAASGAQGLWVPSDDLVARVMDELEGGGESSKLKAQSSKQVELTTESTERVGGGGLFGSRGRML